VMHPETSGHLAAGSPYVHHLAERRFVPQFVAIDLNIIPADTNVRDICSRGDLEFDDIPRQSAMARPGSDADRVGLADLDPLNYDDRRRVPQAEPAWAGYLNPPPRLSPNDDGL